MLISLNHIVGNQKSVTAKLLESPDAVKMDNLTVTRLRSECRLRRLPVSGRKRNLVLRLLPFADAILNGSRNTTSKKIVSATCGSFLSVAGPTTTSDQSKSEPVEGIDVNRPFVPMDSFMSGFSSCEDDDWMMGESSALDPQSARIVDHGITHQLERAEPLTLGSPVTDNPISSIINHADILADSDGHEMGTDHRGDSVGGHPSLSDDSERADTPSTGESETLVGRWLRQQRLIDELRRELCRYRRALAAARLQSLARSSSEDNDGNPASSLQPFADSDHITDDDILRYPPSLSDFTSKRYANHSITDLRQTMVSPIAQAF